MSERIQRPAKASLVLCFTLKLTTRIAGRSVSACRRAFDLLLKPPLGPPASFHFAGQFNPPPPDPQFTKTRPVPGEGSSTTVERMIQAQPFATVNATRDPTVFQATPFTSAEQQGKKRGRPNKEEYERRVREAAERGEIYPRPKKIKTPRPSLEGSVGETSSFPVNPVVGGSDAGSSDQRKPKKAKVTQSASRLAAEIPARTSSIEATASAADQMRIDTEEAPGSTMPDIQAPDFPGGEKLLTEMREHAALAGPGTIERSTTLRNEPKSGADPNLSAAIPNPPIAMTEDKAPQQEASTEHPRNEE